MNLLIILCVIHLKEIDICQFKPKLYVFCYSISRTQLILH